MVMKFLKSMLGILSKSKITGMVSYRSESTGAVYRRPMYEFKDKFKEFGVGI